ncbi:MAG TPA: DNA polymerase III subunit chi [Alphaproteobacteria bacterium]
MAEIRFYHAQTRSAEEVLPDLLSKALQRNLRVACKFADEERMAYYDNYLWRYQPQSFLPHGTVHDGQAIHQPVLLTTEDHAANAAKTMMVLENATLPEQHDFDLLCLVFDGHDPLQIQQARQQWARLKEQNDMTLSYWQQQENGQWINKA